MKGWKEMFVYKYWEWNT